MLTKCPSCRQTRIRSPGGVSARGFTLIELIMVIVMLGVLAVFAAPRLFNSSDFYARGFHDETLALLRYAQKTAIAQRRTVCVAFTSSSATLSIATNAATSTCDMPLSGPSQNCTAGTPVGAKGCITARSGVLFSPNPSSLSFDGLGQPSAGQTIQVSTASGAAGNPIVVEAQTGYVHD
jgi:MSHA pilin protein MshC